MFHQRLPGYARSPLRNAAEVAARLDLERCWVKDESSRFGLPAFKILGASWAVYRAVSELFERRTGREVPSWSDLEDLRRHVAVLQPLTLTCATDGNHGRAVAHMARLLGFGARVYVPADMAPARIAAIAGEGAAVVVLDGTYDDAVARSAADAAEDTLVISDTSWPGYQTVPGWVIEGYSTILWEVADQLAEAGEEPPDLIAVQVGVGALAAAVIGHVRHVVDGEPFVLAVEPTRAACALASMEAGRIVQLPGPHDSIMSGLNCGQPSLVAWPMLSGGCDAFIAIDDEWAREAMRGLATDGIVAGECGAAGVAGLLAWRSLTKEELPGRRALVFVTEGATDPEAYAQIMEQGAG